MRPLLDDLEEATAKIDEALRICLSQNKPVFLEIPTNIQVSPCPEPTIFNAWLRCGTTRRLRRR